MTTTTLLVADGRVECPRLGDTDVDVCASCADLVGFRSDGDHAYVRCHPAVVRPPVRPYGI